jgi:hypothetical protein
MAKVWGVGWGRKGGGGIRVFWRVRVHVRAVSLILSISISLSLAHSDSLHTQYYILASYSQVASRTVVLPSGSDATNYSVGLQLRMQVFKIMCIICICNTHNGAYVYEVAPKSPAARSACVYDVRHESSLRPVKCIAVMIYALENIGNMTMYV